MIKVTDINTWNYVWGQKNTFSFSIDKLTENIISDDIATKLELFISDRGFITDIFNVEYMGYLTGQVNCTKEELAQLINDFCKEEERRKE